MTLGYFAYLYIISPRSEFRTTAKESHVILLFSLFWFSHFWQPAYLARKFHQKLKLPGRVLRSVLTI